MCSPRLGFKQCCLAEGATPTLTGGGVRVGASGVRLLGFGAAAEVRVGCREGLGAK